MTKVLFAGLVLLLMMMLGSRPIHAQNAATFRQWSDESQARIELDFRAAGSHLYYENSSRRNFGFAWPSGIQMLGLIASRRVVDAQAMADEFHSRYWCYLNNRWGYDAVAGGCGDRYYDDNAWIARAFMELYEKNGNANNLARAREIIAFSMSGENIGSDPGGGIRFHEGDRSGQCLCATAPTLLTGLMIYQAIGVKQYLTDALRLYNWVKGEGFGFGPGFRGYENAVIAQAAIRLYRITGDVTYWNDAKHLGLAMESAYIDLSTRSLKETGQWGGQEMTNAYVRLYEVDGDVNWLNIAAGFLSFLHDRCKDKNGQYPELWNTPGVTANPMLLHQATAARAFAIMSTTPGGVRKAPDPVTVFKDCNYAGTAAAGFFMGRYSRAALIFSGISDNEISSLKVQPGYRVTLYDQDNFQGNSVVKTSDEGCLAGEGWNDRARSMVIDVIDAVVMVYNDCNYKGRGVHLSPGDYTQAQLQARGIRTDDIASLSAAPGVEIHAFEADNFAGREVTLSGDNPCLVDSGLNTIISSIQVR